MSRSRVRVGRWVAVLAVISLVGAIGVSAAGAQQNPPVDQPGVTDSEIRVGGVGTVSGDPTGNNPGGPAFDGTQAYFDYINSTGEKGVCGRKLVLASNATTTSPTTGKRFRGYSTTTCSPRCPWRRPCSRAPICSSGMGSPLSDGCRTRSGGPRTSTRGRPTCSVKTDRSSTSNLQVPATTTTPGSSEAQQEAGRPDRVQRAPVLGICRRHRRDLQEVPEGGKGRVQGHEPPVRHCGLQRAGRQDEGARRSTW